MSNVPAPQREIGKLAVNIEAERLATHTFHNLVNQKYFPQEQKVFIDHMRSLALDIHLLCYNANNIKVDNIQSRYERRINLEDIAAEKCTELIGCIEFAKRLFHLPWRKTKYWIEEYSKLRKAIRAWYESDVKRLKPQ